MFKRKLFDWTPQGGYGDCEQQGGGWGGPWGMGAGFDPGGWQRQMRPPRTYDAFGAPAVIGARPAAPWSAAPTVNWNAVPKSAWPAMRGPRPTLMGGCGNAQPAVRATAAPTCKAAEELYERVLVDGYAEDKSGEGKAAGEASKGPFQRVFRDRATGLGEEELALLQQARVELEVVVDDRAGAYPPIVDFDELECLPEYLQQALKDANLLLPMPIQAQALPIILGGRDLIGIARTGSGKTLAFLIPAVVHIEAQEPVPRGESTPIALVLAPTRELAAQIATEAGKLLEQSRQGSHSGGIWAECVYGGKQRGEQLRRSKGCAIIAGTPGRLMDFMNSGDMSLGRVTYFVLDEADRMLDFGFSGDVTTIGNSCRADRHMLFFSATWPAEVQELAKSLCHEEQQPLHLTVGQGDDGAATTRSDIVQEVAVFDQESWDERDDGKKAKLYAHLRSTLADETAKILVFVSNKVLADELRDQISTEGFKTESMHGGKKQYERDESLANFKNNDVRLLVATDVMGRGLDIPDITHVVIYDMGDVMDYVHRIGRTARGPSGKPGHALTLFEYNQKWPELAGGLADVLRNSGQVVPPELLRIADEVENGTRKTVARGDWKKNRNKDSDWGSKPDWKENWKSQPWKDNDWSAKTW
mmetsp:Transcript_717/g.2083  ORF Transcript_717/g.2083 Transcript_717/m.2083 type:complete len:644 (+) Transcript_717:99-2030(+)